jgi:hypothetical protein
MKFALAIHVSAGLAAVAYGPDSHEQMDDDFARNFWKMQTPPPISWKIPPA